MTNRKQMLVFLIVLLFLCGTGCSKKISNPEGLKTPSNTKVILHLSSQVDPRTATMIDVTTKSYAKICYFDQDGNVLGSFEKNDEVISDFIVESNDAVAYFFKNNSFLSNSDGVSSFAPDSGITVQSTQFGPYEVGHLDSLGLFYSYFNMGSLGPYPYNMVLRFLSDTGSYDVIVPYYARNICFDEKNERFLCEISSTDDAGDPNCFRYITISYNHSLKRFELDQTVNSIPYSSEQYNDNCFLGAQILCDGNVVYRTAAVPSGEPKKMNLILSQINLEEKIIKHTVIKENYASNELGHPYLIGSADTPMSVHNNKLYVFCSDCSLIVIDEFGSVTESEIPNSFSRLRSRRLPYSTSVLDESDIFFNLLISVEDDGQVYILTVTETGDIQIFRLVDSNYTVVWESKLPEINRSDLMINTFEILS